MALHRVKIANIVNKNEGYKSMSIPSVIHSYSVAMEYMRKWFLSHFDENYFGENNQNFFINGTHAFNDFKNATKEQLLKRNRPNATMGCQVNLQYDRDKVDMYPFGTTLYLARHSTAENAFFNDKIHNLCISQDFEVLEMNFEFNIKVSTKAQQFDMFKYCNMVFRIGATQGDYIEYDQHIPYNLMKQLAKDAGFAIVNDKIVDIIQFLRYLNTHSACPILYKYRNINGNDEFFVRVRNAYVHISIPELDFDDGVQTGHLDGSFGISFTATVRFPSTKCYIYFSENIHTEIQLKEEIPGAACFTTIRMIDAPMYNEKAWKQVITTEYEDSDISSENTIIDLSDLIGTDLLGKIINYNRSICISPEIFLDIRFFNNQEEVKFDIDWTTLKATSRYPLKSRRSFISIYADMEYVNNQSESINALSNKSRITSNGNID